MTKASRCPVPSCRQENPLGAKTCGRCGSQIDGHARVANHAARLFNQGLALAREGRAVEACEFFAALVHWYPRDYEARSALAYAQLQSANPTEARRHWDVVLAALPDDPRATHGIELLDKQEQRAEARRRRRANRTSRKARKKKSARAKGGGEKK